MRAQLVPSSKKCSVVLPVHENLGVEVSLDSVRMGVQELEVSGPNQRVARGELLAYVTDGREALSLSGKLWRT